MAKKSTIEQLDEVTIGSAGVMDAVRAKLVGVVPIIMHNGQLADPRNEYSKALKECTSKKNKTDADYEEVAHIEFLGSLYLSSDGEKRVVLPGYFINGAMTNASRRNKLKQKFQAGSALAGEFPLIYDGPQGDPEALWRDKRFPFICRAKMRGATVMRCRAMFFPWSVEIEVPFFPDQINRREVITILNTLQNIGLGDWWPRYGRFHVEDVR